jgi:hypothetical protein
MQDDAPSHRLLVDPDLSGYENVVGTCSKCQVRIVVNRATDLEWAYPAVAMTATCRNCGESLRIGGDSANHPVDQFRYDAVGSFVERRYMECVVMLSQSMELALLLCVDSWILGLLRYQADTFDADVSQCASDLIAAVDRLTLGQLRSLLLNLALLPRPDSLDNARQLLSRIGKLHQNTPTDDDISRIADEKLRNVVAALRATSFIRLRNAVVHKAYRPTQDEAEACQHDVATLNQHAMVVFGVTPRGGQLVVAPNRGLTSS